MKCRIQVDPACRNLQQPYFQTTGSYSTHTSAPTLAPALATETATLITASIDTSTSESTDVMYPDLGGPLAAALPPKPGRK